MFKVLLRHGAKDVGNKCLHYAISNKDEEMTILLLGKGSLFSYRLLIPPFYKAGSGTPPFPVPAVIRKYLAMLINFHFARCEPQ